MSIQKKFLVFITLLTCLLSNRSAVLPASASDAPNAFKAVLPDLRDEVKAETEGTLSSYKIAVELDPARSAIGGSERIRFINQFDEPLDDVAFRLYPNASYYDEGSTSISDVRVSGKSSMSSLEVDDTVLRVPFEKPLNPGELINISFDFTTVIPADSLGTFGIFSHDTVRGTWVLADWYPIIAGYEPDHGWRLDQTTDLGDPTFSDAAFYDVRVTSPKDLTIVSSGSDIEKSDADNERVQHQFVTGPAREFTLVADNDYVEQSKKAGETTVNIYFNPGTDSDRGAAQALDTAAAALASYSDRYGPYPYLELDIVETQLDGAYGVSWSGVVFLDGPDFLANPSVIDSDPSRLAFTVAHEIGHQWWGGSVGANSNDHTFMIEGLTNYLASVYFESAEGDEAAHSQLLIQIAQPYLNALERFGDGVPDVPIDTPRSGPPSGSLQYGKAALGFLAIRERIGDHAFFAALRDYATKFAFRVATPDDLLGSFEKAGGQDLDDVWNFWFEEASATAADVQALLEADSMSLTSLERS